MSTPGIRRQTAASKLARMHTEDEDFQADLLNVEVKYIQSRPFWGRA